MKKIFIASDHAGVNIKKKITKHLENLEIKFEDFSPTNTPTDDYPDFAFKVSKEVAQKKALGILICGSGIGMSISANKIKGIRAALCRNIEDAKFSRLHNDANILVLNSKTPKNTLYNMIEIFLNTPFEKGRHLRRINKIKKIEK